MFSTTLNIMSNKLDHKFVKKSFCTKHSFRFHFVMTVLFIIKLNVELNFLLLDSFQSNKAWNSQVNTSMDWNLGQQQQQQQWMCLLRKNQTMIFIGLKITINLNLNWNLKVCIKQLWKALEKRKFLNDFDRLQIILKLDLN